jgi:hypothetical protein
LPFRCPFASTDAREENAMHELNIPSVAAGPATQPADDESAPSPEYRKALDDLEPGEPASQPDPSPVPPGPPTDVSSNGG